MAKISVKTETFVHEKESVKKHVFKTEDGRIFEASSFWQPGLNRYDLCISSMSGCLLGCQICECTHKRLGNEGVLSAEELTEQIELMIEDAKDFLIMDKKPFPKLTDYQFDTEGEFNTMILASFMGNGDPFSNVDNVIEAIDRSCEKYGHLFTRFGLSTICPKGVDLAEAMQKFLKCSKRVEKEVWVQHSTVCMDEKRRAELLPAAVPLREAVTHLDWYAREFGMHSRYNFPMIKGVNDTKEHWDKIAEFVLENKELRAAKVSIYNELENKVFEPCTKEEVLEAKKYLESKDLGLIYYYFPESGKKLSAACGQMRAKHSPKE